MYTKKVVWKINETLTCLQKKSFKFFGRERNSERKTRGARWKNVNYNLWTMAVLTVLNEHTRKRGHLRGRLV